MNSSERTYLVSDVLTLQALAITMVEDGVRALNDRSRA